MPRGGDRFLAVTGASAPPPFLPSSPPRRVLGTSDIRQPLDSGVIPISAPLHMANERVCKSIAGHPDPIRCIEVVGDQVWSGGGLVLVHDEGSGLEIASIRGVAAHESHNPYSIEKETVVSMLLVGTRMWCGSSLGGLSIWDTETGKLAKSFKGHDGAVSSLCLVDNTVWSGGGDNCIKVWDSYLGRLNTVLTGHTNWVQSIVCVCDHVWTASDDGTVRVWEKGSGVCAKVLANHSGGVLCLAVVGRQSVWSGSADKAIRVWNAVALSCSRELVGHQGWVTCLAEHKSPLEALPDGGVWSGSTDKTVRLWSKAGSQLRVLQGHGGWVWTVASVPSGKMWSGSSDKTLRLWDVAALLSPAEEGRTSQSHELHRRGRSHASSPPASPAHGALPGMFQPGSRAADGATSVEGPGYHTTGVTSAAPPTLREIHQAKVAALLKSRREGGEQVSTPQQRSQGGEYVLRSATGALPGSQGGFPAERGSGDPPSPLQQTREGRAAGIGLSDLAASASSPSRRGNQAGYPPSSYGASAWAVETGETSPLSPTEFGVNSDRRGFNDTQRFDGQFGRYGLDSRGSKRGADGGELEDGSQARFERQLELARSAAETERREREVAQAQLDAATAAHGAAVRDLQTKLADARGSELENERLKNLVAALQQRNSALEADYNAAVEALHAAEEGDSLDSTDSEIETLRSAVATLGEQLADARQQLDSTSLSSQHPRSTPSGSASAALPELQTQRDVNDARTNSPSVSPHSFDSLENSALQRSPLGTPVSTHVRSPLSASQLAPLGSPLSASSNNKESSDGGVSHSSHKPQRGSSEMSEPADGRSRADSLAAGSNSVGSIQLAGNPSPSPLPQPAESQFSDSLQHDHALGSTQPESQSFVGGLHTPSERQQLPLTTHPYDTLPTPDRPPPSRPQDYWGTPYSPNSPEPGRSPYGKRSAGQLVLSQITSRSSVVADHLARVREQAASSGVHARSPHSRTGARAASPKRRFPPRQPHRRDPLQEWRQSRGLSQPLAVPGGSPSAATAQVHQPHLLRVFDHVSGGAETSDRLSQLKRTLRESVGVGSPSHTSTSTSTPTHDSSPSYMPASPVRPQLQRASGNDIGSFLQGVRQSTAAFKSSISTATDSLIDYSTPRRAGRAGERGRSYRYSPYRDGYDPYAYESEPTAADYGAMLTPHSPVAAVNAGAARSTPGYAGYGDYGGYPDYAVDGTPARVDDDYLYGNTGDESDLFSSSS